MKIARVFSVNNPDIYSGELQDEVYHQSIFAAQQAHHETVERNLYEDSQMTIITAAVKKCTGIKKRRKSCKHEVLCGQKCVYCMYLPNKCGKCHFCITNHLKKACVYRKCPCNCF